MAKKLRKNIIIRRVVAAFVLVIFVFSITPKILLHNVVANHKDTPFRSNFEKDAQLHKAGFNCSCDNLVVESPFITTISPVEIPVINAFPVKISKSTHQFITRHQSYFQLRGPPANQTV